MLHKRYSFGSAPLDMLLHLCSVGYAPAMSKFHLDSGHVRFTFRLYLLFVFQLYSVGCSIYILPMFQLSSLVFLLSMFPLWFCVCFGYVNFGLISVQEVGVYFFTCVLKSRLRSRFIWTLKIYTFITFTALKRKEKYTQTPNV